MELQGQIISVLPTQRGTSKQGNEWALLPFVIETKDQYPKKVCFEVFGAEKVEAVQGFIKPGADVTVSFDLESREYNGRWYTSARAWKVLLDKATAEAMQEQRAAEQQIADNLFADDTESPF